MKKPMIPTLFFGISLALTAAPARAATDLVSLQAEVAEIESLNSRHELACPTELPSSGQITVAFEGMNGFCPKYARTNLPSVSGAPPLFDRIYEHRMSKDALESADAARLLARLQRALRFEGTLVHSCFLEDALETVTRTRRNTASPILYYSRRGAPAAAACISHLATLAEAARTPLKIAVIGYSMGGAATFEFAQALARARIEIDQVLTIDPVGNENRWMKSVLVTQDERGFQRPPNVRNWTNVFQKQDFTAITGGIAVNIGIRGSRVIGADQNIELGANVVPNIGKNPPHMAILQTEQVEDSIESLLK